MFSNLSKGSILQGVDRRGEMRWFTGSVERISPSINNQYPNVFGQFPSLTLDIVATVNGERKEFKQVPSNEIIVDFGPDSVILSDSKDALYNYVKSLLKTSEEITNKDNIKKHEKWIPQYKNVLSEMIPGASNASEVKELKEQVGFLQSQLAEALSLLKSENAKTKE